MSFRKFSTRLGLPITGGATGATGITLTWDVVKGSDGYEIQASPTGDFSNASIIASITGQVGTSFFDSTTTTGVTRYYRIRATAGTQSQPHSIKGIWSSPISVASGSGATTYGNSSGSSGSSGWNRPRNGGSRGGLFLD